MAGSSLKPHSSLYSLARTLAERLIGSSRYGDYTAETVRLDEAEAVIREAIEKTLEEAERVAFKAGSADTRSMQGAHAAAAIRSLKQSNSGRAESSEELNEPN